MCDNVGQPGMPRQPPNSQPNPFGSSFFAGLSFAYQLLYLLDATGFYSLGLHVLGIHVCRATGQELVLILGMCHVDWSIRSTVILLVSGLSLLSISVYNLVIHTYIGSCMEIHAYFQAINVSYYKLFVSMCILTVKLTLDKVHFHISPIFLSTELVVWGKYQIRKFVFKMEKVLIYSIK